MALKKKVRIMIYVFALFQVLGIISSVHAILNTRTSQGAIAWVVSLNTVAVVAVPAYWVFGRSKFHGYENAWRDASLSIDDELQSIRQSFDQYIVDNPALLPEIRAVRELADTGFIRGNAAELLVDGQVTYDSIYAGIEQAESYVLFQFYIIRADRTGNRFKELLIRKAEEGIRVFVLYDELGSIKLPTAWINEIRNASIEMIPFNTRQGPQNRFQLNFRNHRKIVVVDGKTAWLGGLNVGDDYLGKDKKLTPWRDTHLELVGPVALVAQAVFLSDWNWASRDLISGLNWIPSVPKNVLKGEDGVNALVLQSGPADEHETASLFFTQALNQGRERIWIATPYFIPDEATMVALRLALLKGLDVRIITPELNDNWLVRQASNVYLEDLSDMGARIYFYEKGFMHQKVMLVDDRLAMVGTVNFDNRSFRLNFEITAALFNRDFAHKVQTMLQKDLANSSEAGPAYFEKLSAWERLKSRGSALLAPVL
jgi:cardiolipin synthase